MAKRQKKETDKGGSRTPIKTKTKREQLKEKPIEVTLLKEEKESQEQLINAFKTLGYEL